MQANTFAVTFFDVDGVDENRIPVYTPHPVYNVYTELTESCEHDRKNGERNVTTSELYIQFPLKLNYTPKKECLVAIGEHIEIPENDVFTVNSVSVCNAGVVSRHVEVVAR